MDTFEVSSFTTASRGTFRLIEEVRSGEPTLLHAPTLPGVQVSSEHVGVAEMKRQQWESLKPLIQRVYIEEDKPFRCIANILREDHGFKPTKRQFLRKMDEWGFRKYVSRSERLKILEALPRDSDDAVPNLKDRRLKPGKLKNWRRRYRGEVTGALLSLSQRSRGQAAASQPFEYFSYTETQIHQASDSKENSSTFSVHGPRKNLDQDSAAAPFDTVPMEICEEAWPFDWSTVDVIDSPGLSRLFKGCEIECAASIPPLSLDTSDSEDPPCLSTMEIQELSKNRCKKETDNSNSKQPFQARRCFLSVETYSNKHPHYPWRDVNTVFCGYNPDPLNEVYVFPQSRSTLDRTFSKVTLWESLEADQAALEFKLARLKKQFNVDHPAILAATDDLLRVYYRSQKSTKAERMSRELLNLYNQILGPKNLKTLHVRLYVINFMIMQGQFPAAQTLAKDLYSDIFDIVQPDHPLALGIMDTQANLAWKLENIETALSLRRQILQIKLASAGLRHTHTIRAMNKLGCLMAGATKNEAEILLRNTIQLLQEDPAGAEEEQCEALGMLAFFQKATGACEESYKVVTEAIERFSLSLGPKHPEIFKLKSELAWNLFVRGKVIESENLFRALDSLYSNGEVEINQAHVANVWAGLDESLLQMGRTAESIGWREKCVDARLSCFGANHSPTATICYYLTDWYELQGQYEDALKLYHRMLDQIRESGMDPHGAIPTLESKILRTEEKMVLSTSNSTISYEESSGYESDSYDGDSAEEGDDESMGEPDEGVDGEVDTQGIGDDEEGGEQEEEDWMTFIRDDIPTS